MRLYWQKRLQCDGQVRALNSQYRRWCLIICAIDNYAVLLTHFTRQYSVDADEIKKYLGVTDDYEDIC